jgi:hypothetical protein
MYFFTAPLVHVVLWHAVGLSSAPWVCIVLVTLFKHYAHCYNPIGVLQHLRLGSYACFCFICTYYMSPACFSFQSVLISLVASGLVSFINQPCLHF